MKKKIYFTSIILSVLCLFLTMFFYIKMNQTHVLLDELIYEALNGHSNLNIEQKAILISDKIYRETNSVVDYDELDWYSRLEATSFFNMSSAVGLEYNCYGIKGRPNDGPCGTMTKIFLLAMWELDVRARKLQLHEFIRGRGGHTMAEFFYKGKWRVISPSDSSFVWRNPDGSIATVEEIQTDTTIFQQIYNRWRPNWQYGFRETSNINWNKLPSFVTLLLKIFLGDESFKNAETPRLYEQPRKLLFLTLTFITLLFILISYLLRRSIKKSK